MAKLTKKAKTLATTIDRESAYEQLAARAQAAAASAAAPAASNAAEQAPAPQAHPAGSQV